MSDQPALCSFEAQFARVLEATECRTQVELADFFDIRQSSISDARRRKSIPAEWRVKLFEKKRINPQWIQCGAGGKYLTPTEAEQNQPHVVRVTEVRPPEQCSAQELFNELVCRAMQQPSLAAIQQAVADTWTPMAKQEDPS